MADLSSVLLTVGGALLVVGPPAFILLSMEGRVRGRRKSPGRLIAAAMWTSLAAYAALATCAVLNGLQVPPGPWWERLLVGMARLPIFAQGILVVSGVTVFGSWWMLREERERPVDGGPTASDGGSAPRG